jgi:lactate dehydrogenase-like 2-hydroxyacid dehydrogenase
MKYQLINKKTKEVITMKNMPKVSNKKIAEIVFGLMKHLNKKDFRKLYEVKEGDKK